MSTPVIGASVGFEQLSGTADDLNSQFTTTFATAHKFNGWADKFLNTPSIGLVDTFATLRFARVCFARYPSASASHRTATPRV